MDLKSLSDKELEQRTRGLIDDERRTTVALLRHLEEIDRRKLYLERGYPTLYEYVIKELRISEGAAHRRIQAMRLLREVPSAEAPLSNGDLPLTTAAKIQTALKQQGKELRSEVVKDCLGKSYREVERRLAEVQPQEKKEYSRWLSSDQVQLTVHLDKGSFISLHELRSLRAHAPSAKTYGGLISDLVELGHIEWNPLKRTATPTLASQCKTSLRDRIWQRDQGQCTYQDPATGNRCNSRHLLQVDHIHPRALGGTNDESNLRLLCAQHNRHRAEKTFGAKPTI